MSSLKGTLKMATTCRNMSGYNLELINKNPLLFRAFGGHFTTILKDARSIYQDDLWMFGRNFLKALFELTEMLKLL
jgi:hypothetical protein